MQVARGHVKMRWMVPVTLTHFPPLARGLVFLDLLHAAFVLALGAYVSHVGDQEVQRLKVVDGVV